jgi:hypothetical protein
MIGSSDYAFLWIALNMMEMKVRNSKKAGAPAVEPETEGPKDRVSKRTKAFRIGIRKAFAD